MHYTSRYISGKNEPEYCCKESYQIEVISILRALYFSIYQKLVRKWHNGKNDLLKYLKF